MLAFYMTMIDDPADKVAFEDIYKRYKDKMLSLSYRITGNYHDAEEAVSQAFFSIAKNFRKIKERTPEERSAYIRIVTKNAALSVIREKQKYEFTLDENEEYDIPDEKTNVSDEVLSSFGYERVLSAIRSLPEIYAESLYMFNVTGLSIKEIAVSLSVDESVIKTRLRRAREKLRTILEEQGVMR